MSANGLKTGYRLHPRVDSAATPNFTTSDRALGSAAEIVSGIYVAMDTWMCGHVVV